MKKLFLVLSFGIMIGLSVISPALACDDPQDKINIEEEKLKFTISSGQPPTTFWSLGTLGSYQWDTKKGGFQFHLKIRKNLFLKQLALLNWEGTAGVDYIGHNLSPSLGGYLNLFYLSVGLRYRPLFDSHKLVPVVAFENALYRGGTLGIRGAEFRAEWSPGVFSVGLTLNLNERPGQHRPRKAHVDLPKGQIPSIQDIDPDLLDPHALYNLKHSILRIDKFVTPAITKDSLAEIKEQIRDYGRTLQSEDRRFHENLEKAFATALSHSIPDPKVREEEALKIALKTENIIFREVIIPFNRLLGQRKKPMSIKGLGSRAYHSFSKYLDTRSDPGTNDPMANAALKEIFRQLIQHIDMATQNSRYRWKDNRLAEFLVKELDFKDADTAIFNWGVLCWIPLNYGLRLHQYDTQEELNEVIGEILGDPFTGCNKVAYLINEQWHHELLKMIQDTKYYHVLIVHDYSGVNKDRIPDEMTWDITLSGYCESILKGIDDCLSGKRAALPHFSIFLDQHYYEFNNSRKVLTFLEHLYNLEPVEFKWVKPRGKGKNIERNQRNKNIGRKIRAIQDRLKIALERLKEEKSWTEDDIKNQVKVHINITNKQDETFAAYFIREDFIRDHRKIAFRDVFEDAPCWGSTKTERGVAIFTGQGVGENYLGADWEDRSIKVEGVDLVKLKNAVRELFLSQNPRYKEKDVPYYLRPRPYPDNYDTIQRELTERGFSCSIVTTMNRTGYATKKASVLKAALYNLIPKGGTIIAPDSLWNNDFWLGMFVGAALRGVDTYLIGPSAENAPSDSYVALGSLHDSLLRGMYISQEFKEELKKSGGSMNIGLYKSSADATNIQERLELALKGFETNDNINALLSVHPDVVELLKSIKAELDESYPDKHAPLLVKKNVSGPQLHLKAQFFASKSAMEILSLKEWVPVLKRYFEERIRQTTGHALETEGITPDILREREDADSPNLIEAFEQTLSPKERDAATFFFTLGSHNQDRRSMFLDGEVLVGVAGYDSLIAMMDMVFLLHASVWPKDFAEFSKYLPPTVDSGTFIKDLL
ncbi:MAG: hypothetical protein GQ545_08620 [Candidatus Aminicenantes bacterium]|nr:hypothetical protein [Candidatus Aminicenantes bacterium]